MCVRQSPGDKSGICCQPRSCGQAGAQCGSIDTGCGTLAQCGTCSPGSDCIDNQCVEITTTTTTDTTTTTLLDNPCIPNPCTSCGYFSFFWCVAYSDGSQQCVFNQGSGGSCSSDANCDVASGDRCAYDTNVGYKRCVHVTGVCPDTTTTTTTTSTTTTTTQPPCPAFQCGGDPPNYCNGNSDCVTFQSASNQCTGECGVLEPCGQACSTDAECGDGYFCVVNSCCAYPSCKRICPGAPQ
jgi:hypothetical protein